MAGAGMKLTLSIFRAGARVIREEGVPSFCRKAARYLRTPLQQQLNARAHSDPLLRFMLDNIPRGSVVYDVGASRGIYSLVLAQRNNCKVYAFEPVPESFGILAKRIASMRLGHLITPFNVAIGSECGPRVFYMSSLTSRSSFYPGKAAGPDRHIMREVAVDCLTIDSLVSKGLCPPPDCIKIDTEGYEGHVIEGAMRVIANFAPVIGLEPHKCPTVEGNTATMARDLLSPLGYEFRKLGYHLWCNKPRRT